MSFCFSDQLLSLGLWNLTCCSYFILCILLSCGKLETTETKTGRPANGIDTSGVKVWITHQAETYKQKCLLKAEGGWNGKLRKEAVSSPGITRPIAEFRTKQLCLFSVYSFPFPLSYSSLYKINVTNSELCILVFKLQIYQEKNITTKEQTSSRDGRIGFMSSLLVRE